MFWNWFAGIGLTALLIATLALIREEMRDLRKALYEAERLIEDLVEGHEGTQGGNFWRSWLALKVKNYPRFDKLWTTDRD